MKTAHFVITLMIAIAGAKAQDLSVRASLDTNKALIGDQIKLRLTADMPFKDWHVIFPQFSDTLTQGIEIVDQSDTDTSFTGKSRRTISKELLITVFDTGFFEVPSLSFGIENNNFRDTLNTLPIVFEIVPVKADSTIRDIKAIYRMPLTVMEVIKYSGILIALALLVLLTIYFIRHRKKQGSGKPMEIFNEPADVIALRELEALKAEKPWVNNHIKYYYSRISEILRIYIERRFAVQALEQTTDEILLSLNPPVCESKEHIRLSNILRLSDLVKFAKVIPEANESALQVDYAAEFVKNTPVPVVPGPSHVEIENETVNSN